MTSKPYEFDMIYENQNMKAFRVVFVVASAPCFHRIITFEEKTNDKRHNHENQTDARRENTEIRLMNVSSTPYKKPYDVEILLVFSNK